MGRARRQRTAAAAGGVGQQPRRRRACTASLHARHPCRLAVLTAPLPPPHSAPFPCPGSSCTGTTSCWACCRTKRKLGAGARRRRRRAAASSAAGGCCGLAHQDALQRTLAAARGRSRGCVTRYARATRPQYSALSSTLLCLDAILLLARAWSFSAIARACHRGEGGVEKGGGGQERFGAWEQARAPRPLLVRARAHMPSRCRTSVRQLLSRKLLRSRPAPCAPTPRGYDWLPTFSCFASRRFSWLPNRLPRLPLSFLRAGCGRIPGARQSVSAHMPPDR